jgi:hypothetical protein
MERTMKGAGRGRRRRAAGLAIVIGAIISLCGCDPSGLKEIKELLDLKKATSLNLDVASVELAKGATKQVSMTVEPSDANEPIYWKSYDTSVAIVSDSGLITAADWGTTDISAYTNNHVLDSRVTTKVSAYVSTIAGNGSSGYVNGIGTAATFYGPQSLTSDGTYLYVADTYNHAIRKIHLSDNSVVNFAGTGSAGSANGAAASSSFYSPRGIASDGTNLYVADTYNSMIRKIVITTGVVSTLAGSTTSGSLNGTGTSARFNAPYDVVYFDSYLYVADYGNHTIRKIATSTGEVTTLAGSTTSGAVDGTGTSASFYCPSRIATDGTYLFVIDQGDSSIRKIDIASGAVTTLPCDAPCYAIALFGDSMIILGYNEIFKQKIDATTWSWNRFAGDYTTIGLSDGLGSAALFDFPKGILYLNGKLYIADTDNHAIRVAQ